MDTVSPHTQDDNTPRKQCKGPCSRWLPATPEFFKIHYKAKDGLVAKCRECRDVIRICGVCGSQKTRRMVSGTSRSVCKVCERRHGYESFKRKGSPPTTDAIRAIKARNRNKIRPSGLKNAKVWRLRTDFGLEEADYLRLLESQDGHCAICQKQLLKGAHVDHDHETGVVRGILCNRCNIGLGYFSESPESLRNAAFYIESWKGYPHETP